ncbi:hypothetical protein FACS189440_20570 [Bacteroidia bacterium]|nr:hypothetical protein FACS189440_20570 [Bacteroidia bacterium]
MKKNSITDNAVFTVSIDKDNYQEEIRYSELFDSLEYIILETSDNVLIKELSQIKYADDKIFVLDKSTQSLFSFDRKGKLIWKIQNIGQGPKEYSQLMDFDIDEKNNQIFLFSRHEKIQVYDFSGQFINEYRIPLRGISFSSNDNKLYLYSGNRANLINGKNENYGLLFIKESTVLKGELPFKEELPSVMIYNSPNAFCKYDNEVRFFMPFLTNIYSIKGDSLYVKYYFDFGKFNLPADYFDNHTVDDLNKSQYAYGLNSYSENQKYCFFKINCNQQSYTVIYFKDQQKVLCYEKFMDDIAYCFPAIYQATNDYFIGARYAEDLFMEYNYSKEKRKNTLLKKIISEITEDNNPVLFFCHLK